MINYELRRAFHRAFFVTLFLGIASGIGGLIAFHLDAQFYHSPSDISCYEAWLYCLGVGEGSFYKAMIPILICAPYLGTIYTERNSSFIHLVTVRTTYKNYFLKKIEAGLISTMVLFFSILIFWFLLCSILYPFNLPVGETNYAPSGAFSGYYQHHPLLYVLLIIVLNVVESAIFFVLFTSISLFVKRKWLVIALPFIIYIANAILAGFYPLNLASFLSMFLPFESTFSSFLLIILKDVFICAVSFMLIFSAIKRDSQEIL